MVTGPHSFPRAVGFGGVGVLKRASRGVGVGGGRWAGKKKMLAWPCSWVVWNSAFSPLWSHSSLKEGQHNPSFTYPPLATLHSLHTNTRDPVWKSFSSSCLWLTAAKTASQLTRFLASPNCLLSIYHLSDSESCWSLLWPSSLFLELSCSPLFL